MPPTFETIPTEIRHNIYSYILLDQNVVYAKEPCTSQRAYGFEFQTALFRVSKFISAESLEYFNSQNAFTAIKFPSGALNFSLLGKIRTSMPVCRGPQAFVPGSFALEVHFNRPQSNQFPHRCAVENTERRSGPQYILPHNFDMETRIRLGSRTIKEIKSKRCRRGFLVHSQDIPSKNFVVEARLHIAVVTARYLPYFIHLLNVSMLELNRWAEKTISSTLTIKFGSSHSPSRMADLLVDGLNGIRGSNFVRTMPDIPECSLLDIKLLGDLSEEKRERIMAMGISTIESVSDTINQVIALKAKGDHCYEQGDFVRAREYYSFAKLLSDLLICRVRCRVPGQGPAENQLTVKAVEVSVRNDLALANIDNHLGFGDVVDDILLSSEMTISGKPNLVSADPQLKADLYWSWGLILEENGAYSEAFRQFEKAYLALPSSIVEAKINEVGALFTHVKTIFKYVEDEN